MDSEEINVFYLYSERVSALSCVFSASFAECANISECFILANSLAEAVRVLYSELVSKFGYDAKYLDSVLLDVKLVKRIDFIDFLRHE